MPNICLLWFFIFIFFLVHLKNSARSRREVIKGQIWISVVQFFYFFIFLSVYPTISDCVSMYRKQCHSVVTENAELPKYSLSCAKVTGHQQSELLPSCCLQTIWWQVSL